MKKRKIIKKIYSLRIGFDGNRELTSKYSLCYSVYIANDRGYTFNRGWTKTVCDCNETEHIKFDREKDPKKENPSEERITSILVYVKEKN